MRRGADRHPATRIPNIGSGEAADIGASRRPDHSNWPFLARTPARPDWAKPGSEAARRTRAVFVCRGLVELLCAFRCLNGYARFERRGYATSGSVSTLTRAG